jgi:hypothetical protein
VTARTGKPEQLLALVDRLRVPGERVLDFSLLGEAQRDRDEQDDDQHCR